MKKIITYSDGGARGNPGPAAFGVLVYDGDGKMLVEHADYIGEGTNNIAEYCGLIAALEIARQFKPDAVECFLDSELVVKQMKGEYKVKQEHIKKLHAEAKKEAGHFNLVTYTFLKRNHEKIKIADKMVNRVLDEEMKKVAK